MSANAAAATRPIDRVLPLLQGVRQPNPRKQEWVALCPAHPDTRPSLGVTEAPDGKVLLSCRSRHCDAKAIVAAIGLTFADLRPGGARQPRRIVTTYPYSDEAGTMLYEVVRYDPKDFRQRRPDGKGGWIWDLNGTRRVLYRLPELLAADPAEPWLCCEGEKDTDRARREGFVATTNAGGAGKWRDEYTETFRGQHVVILPHNDDPGWEHARKVAGALVDVAASVKVVELPLGPRTPNHGKDLSDWFNAGGTADQLRALIDQTPAWDNPPLAIVQPSTNGTGPAHPPTATGSHDDDGRPWIWAGQEDLPIITGECWAAIDEANRPDPRVFRHGGIIVRLERDDHEALGLKELSVDRARHELARDARFYVEKQADDEIVRVIVKPPTAVVRDVLATANPPLPVITRIVEVPVFAPDGSLQTTPGYHPASRTYYQPPRGLTLAAVPVNPTPADVDRARTLILDELLGDFPFVDQADRAHAVAALILPFVRDMIPEPTPGHMIEAPGPGSGKGLLADVLLRPANGRSIGVIPEARDDDEWRKRITSQLREGHSAILIDNIVRPMDSGILSSALTATLWTDRILGKNETARIPVQAVWLATANNPVMTTELARRFVRVRLDPKVDRPWQREGFRKAKLRVWADEQRGQLVWAALTLIRAWMAAGMPDFSGRPLGSYEGWSATIGGILETAGIPGFLQNLDEFYETADAEGAVWRAFVAAWWEKFASNEVGAAELFPLAFKVDGFDLGGKTPRAQQTAFGKALGAKRDRVIGEYRIAMAGISHKAKKWRLLPTRNLLNLGEHGEHRGTFPNPSETSGRGGSGETEKIQEARNVPQRSPCSPEDVADEPLQVGDLVIVTDPHGNRWTQRPAPILRTFTISQTGELTVEVFSDVLGGDREFAASWCALVSSGDAPAPMSPAELCSICCARPVANKYGLCDECNRPPEGKTP